MLPQIALASAPLIASSIAAATENGFDPTTLIGSAVTPVIVVLLLVTGQLRTKGETERLAKDLTDEREARTALQRVLTDEVVPALTRSTDAVTRSTDLMESMARRQAGGG